MSRHVHMMRHVLLCQGTAAAHRIYRNGPEPDAAMCGCYYRKSVKGPCDSVMTLPARWPRLPKSRVEKAETIAPAYSARIVLQGQGGRKDEGDFAEDWRPV